MCVIIAKQKGQELPSKTFLKRAWNTNPNGAGFMFSDGKNVYGYKGFMSFKSFYKFLNRMDIEYDLQKFDVVMHFRIATHGKVIPENTHPFAISEDEKQLKATSFITSRGAFAHNGILHGFGNTNYSDSMDFCKTILTCIDDYKSNIKLLDTLAKKNSSKFAILTPKDLILCGNWQKVNGFLCSNDYFDYDYSKLYKKSNYNYLYDDEYYKSYYNTDDYKDDYICEYCGTYCDDLKEYDDVLLCDDCYKWATEYHNSKQQGALYKYDNY